MARAYSALSCARPGCRLADGRSVAPTYVPHVAAIRFPEAPDRGFGRPRLLRVRVLATHVDDRQLVPRRGGAALHEAADAAVLHRDVARGADEIRLLQPAPLHRRF